MTKSPKDSQILKYVLTIFLGWKTVIIIIAFFGLSFLPIVTTSNQLEFANPNIDFWVRWANWDGGHFRGIAENGYLHSFQVVFFPLYPLLIKALMLLHIPSLWGGIIISNSSIIAALFYLYKLVNLDFDESVSKKVVLITLAFPTAFYFNAVYSESLFLFLTVAAFFYARKKKFLLALLLASLSAVTRLTGLIVILAISLEYFLKISKPPTLKEFWSEFLNRIATYLVILSLMTPFLQRILAANSFFMLSVLIKSLAIFLLLMALLLLGLFFSKFIFKNLELKKILSLPALFLIISFLPFLIYCLFLYFTQDNFLAFISHEQYWQRQLTFPWTAPVNYFKDLFAVRIFQIGDKAQLLLEFISFIFFFILLTISYFKLRLSYTVYFVLSLLLPITTGTLSAIHRYALVIFPIFILLSLIKHEALYTLWIFISLTLLGILTVMFINGYWVS